MLLGGALGRAGVGRATAAEPGAEAGADERIDSIGTGVKVTFDLMIEQAIQFRVFVHRPRDDQGSVGITGIERVAQQALGVLALEVAFGRDQGSLDTSR